MSSLGFLKHQTVSPSFLHLCPPLSMLQVYPNADMRVYIAYSYERRTAKAPWTYVDFDPSDPFDQTWEWTVSKVGWRRVPRNSQLCPNKVGCTDAKDFDVFGLVGQIFEQMTKELFGFFLGSSRVNHGFFQWMWIMWRGPGVEIHFNSCFAKRNIPSWRGYVG